MIYEITKKLAADMRAAGISVPVGYGREHFVRELPSSGRVTIYRPENSDDWSESGRMQHSSSSGQGVWSCRTGVLIRVEGISPKAGARRTDHERFVFSLVLEVMTRLFIIARAQRQRMIGGRGGFLQPDEPTVAELGARYEVQVAIDSEITTAPWQYADRSPDGDDPIAAGTTITIKAPGDDGENDSTTHIGASS